MFTLVCSLTPGHIRWDAKWVMRGLFSFELQICKWNPAPIFACTGWGLTNTCVGISVALTGGLLGHWKLKNCFNLRHLRQHFAMFKACKCIHVGSNSKEHTVCWWLQLHAWQLASSGVNLWEVPCGQGVRKPQHLKCKVFIYSFLKVQLNSPEERKDSPRKWLWPREMRSTWNLFVTMPQPLWGFHKMTFKSFASEHRN